MKHDQLFKELLQEYLREFCLALLPRAARQLRWDEVEFLGTDLFTDQPVGRRRQPDLVARVRTLSGGDACILIHLEIEASPGADFPRRMYEYHSLLWTRYGVPVLPIAVFIRASGRGQQHGIYAADTLGEEVLRFRYHLLALRDIVAADLPADNPITHALLPLLKGRPRRAVEVRWQAYRGLVRTVSELHRQALLAGFVDAYTPLSEAELAELRERADNAGEERAMSLLVPDLVKLGREEGREAGREEGVAAGLQEALLRVLRLRLGECPADVAARVRALQDTAALAGLLDRVMAAESLEEFRAALP